MPGSGLADSSQASSMDGTTRKFEKAGGQMYPGIEDSGRGSFNYQGAHGQAGFGQQQPADLSNQLNRVSKNSTFLTYQIQNMSQSHLTAAANAADSVEAQIAAQKEVELKAMGENSQMFQDSILQGS